MNTLTFKHEEIATKIVNAAYIVHKSLGPGLLERIYEACLAHELTKAGLKTQRQVSLPIVYDGLTFEEGYRIDLLVENLVVIELKAAEDMNSLWEAQLLTYLKLMNLPLGFIINFNVPIIKQGIHRYRL